VGVIPLDGLLALVGGERCERLDQAIDADASDRCAVFIRKSSSAAFDAAAGQSYLSWLRTATSLSGPVAPSSPSAETVAVVYRDSRPETLLPWPL